MRVKPPGRGGDMPAEPQQVRILSGRGLGMLRSGDCFICLLVSFLK